MSNDSVVAVDVGGTTIKAAVVDRSGAFVRELSLATPAADGPDAVVAALLDVIAALASGTTSAVGVVVPGAVDAAGGRAVFSANLGFRDMPLRDIITEASGLPALLEHDVRAAGAAERAVGATAGIDDYVLAVIGTGIAAVVQARGQTVLGATGVPGELGHIPVWPGGELCSCGQRGCLERYASAGAIARRYAQRSGRPGLAAHEVIALVDHDADARAVWEEATEALALAFATCTLLLDPEVIVLAGGLSEAGHAILTPVQEKLAKLVVWHSVPEVRLSPLGGRAGLVGTAVLAWELAGVADFTAWRP